MKIVQRFKSVDPLASDYAAWSPYNYVLGNPLMFTDPDGRALDNVIIENCDCERTERFVSAINKNFNGQFVAYTEGYGENSVRLRIATTEGGGDLSKLSKGQQAFYKKLNFVAESVSEDVNFDIVSGESGVSIGKYNSYPAQIDIADVEQFPVLNPNIESQDGATQAGKIIHEIMEQYFKQVSDENREPNQTRFNANHLGGGATGYEDDGSGNGGATGAENSVNGNIRISDYRYRNTSNQVHEYKYSNGKNGVINLTKKRVE